MYRKAYFNRIQLFDFWRNLFLGSLSPIVEVVAMLIFIEKFKATVFDKTLLVFFLKSGFIMGVPVSLFLFRKKYNLNISLFIFSLVAFFSSIFSLISSNYLILILLFTLMVFPFTGTHPLVAEIYNLYPQASRGRKFVSSNIAFFLGSIIFSFIYNLIFKNPLLDQSLIFLIAAFAVLFSGIFTLPLPKIKFSGEKKPSFKSIYFILKKDKLFLYIIIIWNIFGTANLWLLPYRTNLLAENIFGFNYNQSTILFLLVIIPEILFIIFNIPFGYLFDKYNFIVIRIILNILLLLYALFFFLGNSIYYHVIGITFYGLARSGGSIAWKLWVNKIVPKKSVALYMNIHVAFTGVRMMLAPLFGLIFLYKVGPEKAGLISAGFFLISILMLFPLIPYAKKRFYH